MYVVCTSMDGDINSNKHLVKKRKKNEDKMIQSRTLQCFYLYRKHANWLDIRLSLCLFLAHLNRMFK